LESQRACGLWLLIGQHISRNGWRGSGLYATEFVFGGGLIGTDWGQSEKEWVAGNEESVWMMLPDFLTSVVPVLPDFLSKVVRVLPVCSE
jgi:hypothetical protein